jgi:hypothetical protein
MDGARVGIGQLPIHVCWGWHLALQQKLAAPSTLQIAGIRFTDDEAEVGFLLLQAACVLGFALYDAAAA